MALDTRGRTEPVRRASWLPGWWWELDIASRRAVVAGILAALAVIGFGLATAGDGGPSGTEGVAPGGSPAAEAPPSGAAQFVASLPEDRLQLWEDLAHCESRGQWDLATGNGFFGGLQFTPESWQGVGGTGLPHEHTREEQILRAELLEDIQGFEAWPACAAELGLA